MRSILKSRLARASIISVLAGLAAVGVAANANAYDGRWGHGWHGHYVPHHEWHGYYGGGWYRPYYYAPPVVTYPPAYGYSYPPAYGYSYPPGVSFNLNVPL